MSIKNVFTGPSKQARVTIEGLSNDVQLLKKQCDQLRDENERLKEEKEFLRGQKDKSVKELRLLEDEFDALEDDYRKEQQLTEELGLRMDLLVDMLAVKIIDEERQPTTVGAGRSAKSPVGLGRGVGSPMASRGRGIRKIMVD